VPWPPLTVVCEGWLGTRPGLRRLQLWPADKSGLGCANAQVSDRRPAAAGRVHSSLQSSAMPLLLRSRCTFLSARASAPSRSQCLPTLVGRASHRMRCAVNCVPGAGTARRTLSRVRTAGALEQVADFVTLGCPRPCKRNASRLLRPTDPRCEWTAFVRHWRVTAAVPATAAGRLPAKGRPIAQLRRRGQCVHSSNSSWLRRPFARLPAPVASHPPFCVRTSDRVEGQWREFGEDGLDGVA
jgi:hypothetical protein